QLVATTSDDPSPVIALTEVHAADGGVDRTWVDEADGATRVVRADAAGNVVFESLAKVTTGDPGTHGSEETQVDHAKQQYAVFTVAPMRVPAPPAADPAAELRRRLDSGELRQDGTEAVDGRELVRIVPAETAVPCDRLPTAPERGSCAASEASPQSSSG